VNSAKFITGNFQRHLRDELGWEVEKQINGQDVDAYKEFENVFEVFTLSEDRYVELLEAYEAHHRRSAGPTATSIYIQHCQNAAPSLSEDLKPLESFFVSVSKPIKLRVAIEFETGNVASSFRAANKLEYYIAKVKSTWESLRPTTSRAVPLAFGR
jgi:hypothetical protein